MRIVTGESERKGGTILNILVLGDEKKLSLRINEPAKSIAVMPLLRRLLQLNP